VAHKLTLNNT